ncbi:MAG: hypothetical protein WCA77_08880 [Thermoplasmata archaeon]
MAVGTGAASWVAPYWAGLTGALAALTLAIELIRWGEARQHAGPGIHVAVPVLPIAGGTTGWVLYGLLTILSHREAGVVLGVFAAGMAWSPLLLTRWRRGRA